MADGQGCVLLDDAECSKWKKIAEELQQSGPVAGLFRGWEPDGFQMSMAKVLYVGKATARAFDRQDDEYHSFNGKGHFWSFARQMAKAFNLPSYPLTCVAWTNIAKVSRPAVAADTTVIERYEIEAVGTLQYEIAKTDPDVIVFVSAHFSDWVVRTIADGERDSDWQKSEDETDGVIVDVWWKRRLNGLPILWMPHPERLRMPLREFAAKKVVQLR